MQMAESDRKYLELAIASANKEANTKLDVMQNSVWDDVCYSCASTEYSRNAGFVDGALSVLFALGYTVKIFNNGTVTIE